MLRSINGLEGYHIHALDGRIGQVVDFIMSDEGWIVRYLVVRTGHWLSGRMVLIAPEWVRDIDWQQRQVRVEISRREIQEAPPYDPAAPINREYEAQMYDYYGRPKYWS
jgi:hypothetical protein